MNRDDAKCGDIVRCNTFIYGNIEGIIISKHLSTCDISYNGRKLLFLGYEFIDSKLTPEEEFAWRMES